MKKQDSLFQLIKSMSKSEKGYFKKFIANSTAGEDKVYLQLFDEIDKQKEYNEADIRKKFSGKKISLQLSSYKHYLYNAILRCLKAFYKDASIDSQLTEMLRDAEILMKRSLFSDALSILKKAMEQAEQFERYPVLMEIYYRIYLIELTLLRKDHLNTEYSRKIVEEQRQILNNYSDIIELRHIQIEVRHLYLSSLSEEEKKRKLRLILDHPLLRQPPQPVSIRSHSLYYFIKYHISQHYNHSYQDMYTNMKQVVNLLESFPRQLPEHVNSYIGALNNLGYTQMNLGMFDEFKETIVKLHSLKKKFKDDEIRIFECEILLLSQFYIFSAQPRQGLEYIQSCESKLKQLSSKMNQLFLLAVYDNFSILFLINKKYQQALHYINKIILFEDNISPLTSSFAYCNYLIVQYELGHFDHIEYVLPSYRKFLEANTKELCVQRLLIQLMEKIIHTTSSTELKSLFRHFQEQTNHPTYKNDEYLLFMRVDLWAESKTKGIPLLDLIEQKGIKSL